MNAKVGRGTRVISLPATTLAQERARQVNTNHKFIGEN